MHEDPSDHCTVLSGMAKLGHLVGAWQSPISCRCLKLMFFLKIASAAQIIDMVAY